MFETNALMKKYIDIVRISFPIKAERRGFFSHLDYHDIYSFECVALVYRMRLRVLFCSVFFFSCHSKCVCTEHENDDILVESFCERIGCGGMYRLSYFVAGRQDFFDCGRVLAYP